MADAAQNKTTSCRYCKRDGDIPLLPVRHAVMRDPNVPKLQAFAKGPYGSQQGPNAIEAPPKDVYYTMRLLRPGYLYVYQERLKKWSGYVVTALGYLYYFDPMEGAPSKKVEDPEFSNPACLHNLHPYMSRCIMVKDAAHETGVWLDFSDVPWTKTMFKDEVWKINRMVSGLYIDVQAWIGGKTAENIADFSALNQITEFTLGHEQDTTQNIKNGKANVDKYYSEIIKNEEKYGRNTIGIKKQLAVIDENYTKQIDRITQKAPVGKKDAMPMIDWANDIAQKKNPKWRPIIAGLPDPSGIAMDLNSIALQVANEFVHEEPRKTKYETALIIKNVKDQLRQSAVEKQINERTKNLTEIHYAQWKADRNIPYNKQVHDAEEKMAASKIEKEYDARKIEKIMKETWDEKYAQCIDFRAWENYLSLEEKDRVSGASSKKPKHRAKEKMKEVDGGKTYQEAFDEFSQKTLGPVDECYVAWLTQEVSLYLKRNFHRKDIKSGAHYLELVTELITDSAGRAATYQMMAKQLSSELSNGDPFSDDKWLMRALALNQDELAKSQLEVKQKSLSEEDTIPIEIANDTPISNPPTKDEDDGTLSTWAANLIDNTDRFATYLKVAPGSDQAGNWAIKLSRYLYEISGPMIESIGHAVSTPAKTIVHSAPAKAIGHVVSASAKGTVSVVTRIQINVLGDIARLVKPGAKIIPLYGEITYKQLLEAIEDQFRDFLPDGGEFDHEERARKLIKKFLPDKRQWSKMLLLLCPGDEKYLKKGPNGKYRIDYARVIRVTNESKIKQNTARELGARRLDWFGDKLNTVEKFGQGTVGKIGNPATVISLVQMVMACVTVSSTLHAFKKDPSLTGFGNLVGAGSTFASGVADTVAFAIKNTKANNASYLTRLGITIENRILLDGLGKIFVGVGGVITGVNAVANGVSLYNSNLSDLHPVVFRTQMIGGFIVIAASGVLLYLGYSTLATGAASAEIGGVGVFLIFGGCLILTINALWMPDDWENWLAKTLYFGVDNDEFKNFDEQIKPLNSKRGV